MPAIRHSPHLILHIFAYARTYRIEVLCKGHPLDTPWPRCGQHKQRHAATQRGSSKRSIPFPSLFCGSFLCLSPRSAPYGECTLRKRTPPTPAALPFYLPPLRVPGMRRWFAASQLNPALCAMIPLPQDPSPLQRLKMPFRTALWSTKFHHHLRHTSRPQRQLTGTKYLQSALLRCAGDSSFSGVRERPGWKWAGLCSPVRSSISILTLFGAGASPPSHQLTKSGERGAS